MSHALKGAGMGFIQEPASGSIRTTQFRPVKVEFPGKEP